MAVVHLNKWMQEPGYKPLITRLSRIMKICALDTFYQLKMCPVPKAPIC